MSKKLYHVVLLLALVFPASPASIALAKDGSSLSSAPFEPVQPPAPVDPAATLTGTASLTSTLIIPNPFTETLPLTSTQIIPQETSSTFTETVPVTSTQFTPQEISSTFTVDSTEDLPDTSPGDSRCAASNGKCTLRAAVMEANAKSDADTIVLPAQTFYLGSQLAVTQPVTIKGAGQGKTIIDGQSATRVFRFAARSGSHAISDLTIQNGYNKSTDYVERNGGGIFTQTDLRLDNVTVKTSRAYEGGGIFNRYYFPSDAPAPHTLRLYNVTLTGNSTTSVEPNWGGGGLFNGSNLIAEGLWITNNSVAVQGGGMLNNTDPQYGLSASITRFIISGNTAKDGAGIDNDMGTMTLRDGKITGNVASCCRPTGGNSTGGGGIYNNWGNLTLVNVDVSQNQATAPQGYGGGIYNSDYATLINVSMTGNTAPLGAAIHNGNYQSRPNQLSLTNATLASNSGTATTASTAEGAAVFNVQGGRVSILNSTITQNRAQISGGITNYNTNGYIELRNTILMGNTDELKAPDCVGTLTSLGNNILGNTTGSKTRPCKVTSQTTDQVGSNPLFAPAGLKQIIANVSLYYLPLSSTSPAINHGTNTQCPKTDEINTPRPYNGVCDIGAIEYTGSGNTTYNKKTFLPVIRRY